MYDHAKWLILPVRRERSYPMEVKTKEKKYPDKRTLLVTLSDQD